MLDWYFKARGFLPIPWYLLLVALGPGALARWGLGAPAADDTRGAWALAGGLWAAGEGLRLWGRRSIGRSSDTRRLKAATLVTGGPFAHVRNPLYLGNVLIAAAAAAACGVYAAVPATLALIGLHYRLVVAGEERLLASLYGAEYAAYCTRVRRFLPGRAHGGAPSPPKLSWAGACYAERRQLLGQTAAFAVFALKDWYDWALIPWSC